jgi:hypothetical protein
VRDNDRSTEPPAPLRFSLTPAADAPLATGLASPALMLSADGRRLIYQARWARRRSS